MSPPTNIDFSTISEIRCCLKKLDICWEVGRAVRMYLRLLFFHDHPEIPQFIT